MRIGEIAALVGVTTRAVRHYHHVGLLPEPERRSNGYRAYSVRDAVLLARVRRLTELGLSLDEVRDVLADDAGREPADVLEELDADLARQEAELAERRRRLAVLLAAPPGETEPVSPALAALLAKAPKTASPSAAMDREHLTLLDVSGAAGEELYAASTPTTRTRWWPRCAGPARTGPRHGRAPGAKPAPRPGDAGAYCTTKWQVTEGWPRTGRRRSRRRPPRRPRSGRSHSPAGHRAHPGRRPT
ncbi:MULTISPECIES: MerR family transcriptional regulator [unclassified Streptomyces]|uniref:MerR family transcriptional regulator n=1 Tax=unclassified Streptomyces TaxID=2593676 RepID=UPI0034347EB9